MNKQRKKYLSVSVCKKKLEIFPQIVGFNALQTAL